MSLTISTTLGTLVAAEPALASLCQLRLGARAAYHLKKLAQLVAQETKHFQEERDALIKELGTPREGGGVEITPTLVHGPDSVGGLTTEPNPQWAVFVARLNELADVPVTIAWKALDLAMLGDEKVSAADLAALGPLVAEPEVG